MSYIVYNGPVKPLMSNSQINLRTYNNKLLEYSVTALKVYNIPERLQNADIKVYWHDICLGTVNGLTRVYSHQSTFNAKLNRLCLRIKFMTVDEIFLNEDFVENIKMDIVIQFIPTKSLIICEYLPKQLLFQGPLKVYYKNSIFNFPLLVPIKSNTCQSIQIDIEEILPALKWTINNKPIRFKNWGQLESILSEFLLVETNNNQTTLKNISTTNVVFNDLFLDLVKIPPRIHPGQVLEITNTFDVKVLYQDKQVYNSYNDISTPFIINQKECIAFGIKINNKYLHYNDFHYNQVTQMALTFSDDLVSYKFQTRL